MKKPHRPEIPRKTIYRLSLYLRCLARLKDNNIQTVSSETLAKVAGVKPTQLRKDLTYLGQFGTRGLGYAVAELSQMISDWRCCPTAVLRRRGLRLSPPSTWTPSAGAKRKSPSRSCKWKRCRNTSVSI